LAVTAPLEEATAPWKLIQGLTPCSKLGFETRLLGVHAGAADVVEVMRVVDGIVDETTVEEVTSGVEDEAIVEATSGVVAGRSVEGVITGVVNEASVEGVIIGVAGRSDREVEGVVDGIVEGVVSEIGEAAVEGVGPISLGAGVERETIGVGVLRMEDVGEGRSVRERLELRLIQALASTPVNEIALNIRANRLLETIVKTRAK
jgi:hypothetical protein